MKKIKIEQRIENAVNAFFETENDKAETALTHSSSNALLPNAAEYPSYNEKADTWFGVFKQVFLFFPGTFLLFSLTLALFELFAFSHFHFIADFEMIIGLFFWFSLGSLMVWVGLGDFKNKKHFLLPLTVITTTILFSAPVSFIFADVKPWTLFDYSIYLFPLILILPILVRNYLNEK